MIGSFADIHFVASNRRVRNFNDLEKQVSGRWANHAVIGRKPKKEFLGPDFDVGSFTMHLNAAYGVRPMAAIRSLESFVLTGRASVFILGGRNLGRFVVVSIGEAYEIISQGGKVVKAKVDVSMEEYA